MKKRKWVLMAFGLMIILLLFITLITIIGDQRFKQQSAYVKQGYDVPVEQVNTSNRDFRTGF